MAVERHHAYIISSNARGTSIHIIFMINAMAKNLLLLMTDGLLWLWSVRAIEPLIPAGSAMAGRSGRLAAC